ncbi:MAG: PTS sugar transporter subunit IIC [Atopobiaceae bacterium]
MAKDATQAEDGASFLDKFAEFSAKVGNQVHLRSLRDAFATVMPIYILSGLAVLVNNVVFPLFWAKDSVELANVQAWGNALTQGTLSIAAIILAGIIGYCFAKNKRFENPLSCVIVGISSLVIMMPQTVTGTLGKLLYATNANDKTAQTLSYQLTDIATKLDLPKGYTLTGADTTSVLSFTNTGTNGLFGAIIIGLLATTLFIKISNNKKLKVNLGEGVPPAVADSFNVMIPMLLTMAIFGLGAAVLKGFWSTDLMTLIALGVATPLKGVMNAGPWAVIIIYTFANLLFCLGIHQSTISGVLAEPILTVLITENMAMFAAGQPIPADHYMNMQIINTFALIGGSGCTLMLLLDTFLFSKSKASKEVAKLAILPGIFNINEPVIYGYPVVYNLPLMIPFVLVPDLFIGLTYALTCAGVLAPCVVMVPWTTPVFVSGFLAVGGGTAGIVAVIWQVIEVAAGMAIYLPFMKVSERVQAKAAAAAAAEDAE